MSQELENSYRELLESTSLLSHEYGVPNLEATNLYTTTVANHGIDNDLLFLETSYVKLYEELIDKITQLVYEKEVKELEKLTDEEIEARYKSLHLKDAEFYENQLRFRNKTLLNEYLTNTLPILRSIHQNDLTLTRTEKNILTNLKILFSNNAEFQGGSNINQLIKNYNDDNEAQDKYVRLRVEALNLLKYELEPELQQFHYSSVLLTTKRKDLLQLKKQKIGEVSFDDIDSLDLLKEKYNEVVERWMTISVLCDLLPNLIMCIPTNWYNDKKLLTIIHDCEELGQVFSKYQSIVNLKNLHQLTNEELLLVDFEEFKLHDSNIFERESSTQ